MPRRSHLPPASLPLEARRHPLVRDAERALARRCLVPPRARLLVAVSGGPDSVALLVACCVLRGRRSSPAPLAAAHVHHHLRDDADGDAGYVADLCRSLDVPLHIEHVEPALMPGNLADNARRLRYERLAQMAKTIDAPHVAVAHHADDQLETMIIALARGAGVDGLAGMPWTRPLPGGRTLVRPFLGVRKHECESLCRTAGVRWRTDPTNLDEATARGRLRRDLLPLIETHWPDAARRAAGTADVLDAARRALDTQIVEAFGDAERRSWPRRAIADLPAPVIAGGLRRAALRASPAARDALARRHLVAAAEMIAEAPTRPRHLDWPGDLRLRIDAREVRLLTNVSPTVRGDSRSRRSRL